MDRYLGSISVSRGDATAVFLLERLRDLKRGRGSCLLISGAPRAGKTRTLGRFVACAESQAVKTASLRCRPLSIGFGASALSAISFWARGVPQILNHHLRPRRLERVAVESNGSGKGAPSSEISELGHSIDKRKEPLVLALDDLHHADVLSLAVLRSIALAAEELPLLVLATHLSLDLLGEPTRARLGQFVGAAIHRIELSGPATPGLESVNQVAQVSDLASVGEEVDRALVPQPDEDAAKAAANGASSVEALFANLGRGERRALEIAAVLGSSFNPRHLIAVADCEAAEAEAHLAALEGIGLIRRSPEGSDWYFPAGSFHEFVYRQISPSDRIGLHRRVAKLLDALHPYDPETEAAAIAHHYVQGLDKSLAERAAAFTRIAAQSAAWRGDLSGAEHLYARALRAIEALETGQHGRCCDLLIALGEVQGRLGKYLDAQAALSRAAEIASAAVDYPRLAAAVVRMPKCQWPVLAGVAGPAMQFARRALSGLGPADPSRAPLLARIGFEMTFAGDRQQGESMLAQAVQLARELGDRRTLAEVLSMFDRALIHPERTRERLNNAAEVVALAEQAGDRDLLRQGTIIRIRCLLELGEIARAEAEANLLESAALGSGPAGQACALMFSYVRAFREGRVEEAENLGHDFRALASTAQMPEADDFYWPAVFACFAEQGRLGELEPLVRETLSRHPTMGVFRALLAWLYVDMRRTADARFHFERLALAGFSSFANEGSYLVCLVALSMVASELDDRTRCQQLYELLLPYAARAAVMGPAVGFGSVERYLAHLAAALGRPVEAIERLERAIEFNCRIGGRLWSGYAACELARVLIRQSGTGHRERAAKLRAEVIEAAAQLGMGRLRALAERIEMPPADTARDRGSIQPPAEETRRPDRAADGEGRPPDPSSATRAGLSVFLREADFWTLSFADETIRVKHSRGLELISVMLKSPGRRFHAAELCAILDGHVGAFDATAPESKPDAMLDGRARSSYRERLHDLNGEIEEARSLNDLERAARLEEEKAFVTRELARAVGLGGADRRMASRSERARTRVTNAIRNTLHKISQNHPDLGRYLTRTVKTGTFCRFDPDGSRPVSWLL